MKKKIVTIIIIGVLISFCKQNEYKTNDEFRGKQWYVKNNGVCREIELDPEFCEITEFKKIWI